MEPGLQKQFPKFRWIWTKPPGLVYHCFHFPTALQLSPTPNQDGTPDSRPWNRRPSESRPGFQLLSGLFREPLILNGNSPKCCTNIPQFCFSSGCWHYHILLLKYHCHATNHILFFTLFFLFNLVFHRKMSPELIFFLNAGDGNQDLIHAKQASILLLSYNPNPFTVHLFSLLWNGISLTCPGWVPICNPIASSFCSSYD